MKVKRMGITEILRRIWLFSAYKIKSSESLSKQPTQLIVELNSSLRHIIVTNIYRISILEFDQNSCILLNRNNKPIFDVELYDPIEKTWTIDEKRALPYLIHK